MCPSDATPSPDTRDALIEAALACFAKYGYEATSIRLVASMAGKNSSLISYYFKSKEGLYREVFRYVLAHFAAKTGDGSLQDPDPAPGDPQDARARLRAHIQRVLHQVDAHFDASDPLREPACRLWLNELQAPRHEVRDLLLARMEPFVREARACLRAIRPDLSPEEVDFWGITLHGSCIHHALMNEIRHLAWTSADPSLSLEAMADRLADFTYHGLSQH
ncbi:TetR/AcrR family transcriptional regulator [Geothrix fuzhouensis]|uniref:TetR/AcrR family transcriptional regulator n=1 Tax=Geothrix fuzhouensis TaxID=2966451 RepID=UPI00214787EC|nr:TetR/AcrR family transcriptional regulator [Geothrix fuzhouensis]